MYVCNGYNLFTYLVTLHAENLNKRFSFLYTHPWEHSKGHSKGVQLSQLHQQSKNDRGVQFVGAVETGCST